MTIYFASDHAGFELKKHLLSYVQGLGYTAVDKGPFTYDERDDYPDFVRSVSEEILKDPGNSLGIILGWSGQGEAITVNRFKGIRANVYYGGAPDIVKLAKEHNNSNILSLGAHFVSVSEAESAIKTWLETPFSGSERHIRRIEKIDQN